MRFREQPLHLRNVPGNCAEPGAVGSTRSRQRRPAHSPDLSTLDSHPIMRHVVHRLCDRPGEAEGALPNDQRPRRLHSIRSRLAGCVPPRGGAHSATAPLAATSGTGFDRDGVDRLEPWHRRSRVAETLLWNRTGPQHGHPPVRSQMLEPPVRSDLTERMSRASDAAETWVQIPES